jgi:hypothetical protein
VIPGGTPGLEEIEYGLPADGINNSGQVAGTGMPGNISYAFIASPSDSTRIPLPSGSTNAFGKALNDSGQVVGYAQTPNPQAFIGTTAGSSLIPLPGGWTSSYAFAVNDSGQIAGMVENPLSAQAFIGSALGVTLIPLPAGGWNGSIGAGVNDSGQVAGSVYSGAISGSGFQAFIGTAAGSSLIPLPGGWIASYGFAVNDSGQVAGYGFDGTVVAGELQEEAFIGTTAGVTVIPLPDGATTAQVQYASLNNLGVVVGYSDAGAWIWDATDGTVLLNSLMAGPGWNVLNAISINDSGLILAAASYNGGPVVYVELAAIPEPGTFALAGVGLLLAAFVCRNGYRAVG